VKQRLSGARVAHKLATQGMVGKNQMAQSLKLRYCPHWKPALVVGVFWKVFQPKRITYVI
jgi:hypothetical protein